MIKPTVGRKLYFIPAQASTGMAWHDEGKENPQPLDATINYVWGDTCINAVIVDNAGVSRLETSVILVQEGDPVPQYGRYCYWMPYQVGQAKKAAEPSALELGAAARAAGPEEKY